MRDCAGRALLMLIVAVFAISGLGSEAFGSAPGANSAAQTQLSSAEVELGGITVFRFRTSWHGMTPYERASIIYRRLQEILSGMIKAGQTGFTVSATWTADGYIVTLNDQLVVTVDEEHARLNGCTPAALADVWAANLRKAVENYLAVNAR